MNALAWATQPYGTHEAASLEGDWRLSRTNVVDIGFSPARPEGVKTWDLYKTLKEKYPDHESAISTYEYQRDYAYCGVSTFNERVAMAENWHEAYRFVETIRAGDAGLPSAEEQLRAAGFKIKWPDHKNLENLWSLRIKSGDLDVSLSDDDDSRMMYTRFHGDGCNHWHNVAMICHRRRGMGPGKIMIHSFFPENVADPLRVGVAHVLNIMAERRSRERKRFSTPIGGSLPARY